MSCRKIHAANCDRLMELAERTSATFWSPIRPSIHEMWCPQQMKDVLPAARVMKPKVRMHCSLSGMAASYSSRSVLAGSILATLRAGAVVARSVTTESISTTTRMVGTSYTSTP